MTPIPPALEIREFWLQVEKEYSNGHVSGYFSSWDQPTAKPIRVIEYSAYAQANARVAELEKELTRLQEFAGGVDSLNEELQKRIQNLEAALEFYTKGWTEEFVTQQDGIILGKTWKPLFSLRNDHCIPSHSHEIQQI